MSDVIVMHWGTAGISAMRPPNAANVVGAYFPFPEAGFDSDEAAGRWLKGQLASARLAGRPVALVLPRSEVVLRKLVMPNVPDDELPELVRMQAATKSATPINQTRLDFVPLGVSGEGRAVLLATAAVTAVESIVARVRAAGLDPISMGLAPFATARHVCKPDESLLIVSIDEKSAEITICKNGVVKFSHGTDLSGDDDEDDRRWLTSEVSRAIVAADHLAAGEGLDRVVLIGRENLLAPLAEPFGSRYECAVEFVSAAEHWGIAEDLGIAIAPLTAMLGQEDTGGMPRIDFINPRRSIEKPDRTRLIRGLLIGGVAAAVLLAYLTTWWQRRGIEQSITSLENEKSQLESDLEAGEPALEKHTAINTWLKEEAIWTRQLVAFEKVTPGTDRIILRQLILQPANGEARGEIISEGMARSRNDVEAFASSLVAAGYRVPPTESADGAGDYPRGFRLTATVLKTTDALDNTDSKE